MRVYNILLGGLFLMLVGACSSATPSPYSLSEAQTAQVPLPLYYVSNENLFSVELKTTYYYYDYGDDLVLDTYFVAQNDDQNIRIGKLLTCTVCQLIGLPNEATGTSVSIEWAKNNTGYTCEVSPDSTKQEKITGEMYKTCLFWQDELGYKYKFYSIWDSKQSVELINALSK